MAESDLSPEKFRQLETLIGALAESSVSRDYMDAALKDQTVKILNDLQKMSTSIQDINNRNSSLATRNIELQALLKGVRRRHWSNKSLMDEEIKKQQVILKAMHDENNKCKIELEKLMKEQNESLNKNIVQIIHKLLAEQIQ